MVIDIFNTDKRYNIIYADPPWKYKAWNGKGKGKKTAENHYDCMELKEIKELPIKNISEQDAICFMWVTFPCIYEGIEVLKSWGFTYKTVAFVWVKRNKKNKKWFMGLGHWTRANAEICLLGTKGKPTRKSKSVHQIIDEPIRAHSQKPDITREKIIELCGDLPKIELFARTTEENWDAWGNEI